MAPVDSSGGGGLRGGGTEGDQTARFRADLAAVAGPLAGERLGVAVSGGPDSLALLLLAARALPGRIEAATVNHGLRREARDEAGAVASICRDLGLPHAILTGQLDDTGSLQMRARTLRYRLLGAWARERGLPLLATAHHRDDQAETVLMRLARGSGVGGLAGVRRRVTGAPLIVRPLLGWGRGELAAIVAEAQLEPADDPANRDLRHDRTTARQLLGRTPLLRPDRLAAVADHARDADDALDWMTTQLWDARCAVEGPGLALSVDGVPRELRRRLLVRAIAVLQPGAPTPRADRVARLLSTLEEGRPGTIGRLQVRPGPVWQLRPAPPRRTPAPPPTGDGSA